MLSRSLNIEKMVLSGREESNSPAGKDCELFWSTGGIEIPNHKYQTNNNDQNSKFKTCFGH
jgi:hypothetical protein